MAAGSSSANHELLAMAHEGSTPTDQASFDPWEGLNEAQLREALAASIRDKGPGHIDTINITGYLVKYLVNISKHEEALPLAQHAYDYMQRLLPEGDLGLCPSMISLAECLLYGASHEEEAERLHIKVLDITQRTMGHMHPDTISMCTQVAHVQSAMGKHAEAEALHRRAVDFHTRSLGAEHPQTIISITALGLGLKAAGKVEEGVGLLQKGLNLNIRVHGLQHLHTINSMGHLGKAYLDMRDYAQAERMLRCGLGLVPGVCGPHDYTTQSLREYLFITLMNAARWEEAVPLFHEHVEMLQLARGKEDPTTLRWTHTLAARLLATMDRHAEAEQLAARILEPCTWVLGPQHEDTKAVRDVLAACRRALGAAEPQQAASGKAQCRGRRR